jgi:hypothetical protein
LAAVAGLFRALLNRPRVIITLWRLWRDFFIALQLARWEVSWGGLPIRVTQRRNNVATANDDFVDCPLHAITFWCELTLLHAAFDEQVIASVETGRDRGKFTIERHVVPVRVFLLLAGAIFE